MKLYICGTDSYCYGNPKEEGNQTWLATGIQESIALMRSTTSPCEAAKACIPVWLGLNFGLGLKLKAKKKSHVLLSEKWF